MREAPKAAASYAQSRMAALNAELEKETDPEKIKGLKAERAKWDEGGIYRVALHTAIGAAAGGLTGALGAGAAAKAG